MPALQPCPGCGCEIDSGLLWFAGPGLARLCCNKRCAMRAEKRRAALSLGKPMGRRPKPTLPLSDEPIEAEGGWSSLNKDVLALVGAHLGLRDCLAAALTCTHWRSQLTKGSTRMLLRIDDASSGPEVGRASAEAAAGMLDSARALMPQVDTLDVAVLSRCRNQDFLLRHMQALGRWGGLRHLNIGWETPCAPTSKDDGAAAGEEKEEEEVAGGWPRRARSRAHCAARPRPKPPAGPCDQPTRLSPMCLGALGLLTGLQSLSITAAFDEEQGGLFGLSSLERLTALELKQAPGERQAPFGLRDADLGALTSLRSLRAHADLLSPPALAAVGPHLTRLELERLELCKYDRFLTEGPQHAQYYTVEKIGTALQDMTNLQYFSLTVVDVSPPHWNNDRTMNLQFIVSGLKELTRKQLRLQQEHAEQQQAPVQPARQQASPPPHAPRSRHGNARRGAGAGGGAASAIATLVPAGPVEVVLDLSLCLPPLLHQEAYGAGAQVQGSNPSVALFDLDEELVQELVTVAGLRTLDISFGSGAAGNLLRLSELTLLSHLAIRCGPDCRTALDGWDAQRLATSLSGCLRTLVLHLPADCLSAGVLGALELAAGLRNLELTAHPHVRMVPYERWELRTQLLEVAVRERVGVSDGGCASTGAATSAETMAEVNGALATLMFLQQMFTALEGVEEVRGALESEAEWRERQQQIAAEAAAAEAAAAVEDGVAAAVAAEAQAQGQGLEGPMQQQQQVEPAGQPAADGGVVEAPVEPAPAPALEHAEAVAAPIAAPAVEPVAAAVADPVAPAPLPDDGANVAGGDNGLQDFAMPSLPWWVLLPDGEEGPDLPAAAALDFLRAFASGSSDAWPSASTPAPTPLRLLSVDQLALLRSRLVREELVTGPAFRIERWAPRGLKRLALTGFAGFEFEPAGGRRVCFPALEAVEAVVMGEAAVGVAVQGLSQWAAAPGRAPVLRLVVVRMPE